jgi:hypothetical protein
MVKDWIKVLLVAGLALVVINHIVKGQPPRTKVVYKYLPRDLDDYWRTQPSASTQFADMFDADKNKWSTPRYP